MLIGSVRSMEQLFSVDLENRPPNQQQLMKTIVEREREREKHLRIITVIHLAISDIWTLDIHIFSFDNRRADLLLRKSERSIRTDWMHLAASCRLKGNRVWDAMISLLNVVALSHVWPKDYNEIEMCDWHRSNLLFSLHLSVACVHGAEPVSLVMLHYEQREGER